MLDSRSSSTPSVLSLFSGCGGLDTGFSGDDFQILAALDSDQSAITTYNSNHRPVGQVVDLIHFDGGELRPDVIVAGPPCQGFSTGGGYLEDDPRNALLALACEIVARLRPKVAIVENVASLTNSRNKETLKRAITILEDAGYFCDLEILYAPDFGVAQNRRRTVLTARSDNRPFSRVAPKTTQKVSIETALLGIEQNAPNHSPVFPEKGSHHALIAKQIGPAQKLCNVRSGPNCVPTWDIPQCFGQTSVSERKILETIRTLRRRNRKRDFGDADPVTREELSDANIELSDHQLVSLVERGFLRILPGGIDLKNTFNGKYRRLDSKGISPTVDTRFGDIQLFLHPDEDRALTVREAARLQGFKDDFVFPHSKRAAFRQIGNAVPPPMARKLAERCKELL